MLLRACLLHFFVFFVCSISNASDAHKQTSNNQKQRIVENSFALVELFSNENCSSAEIANKMTYLVEQNARYSHEPVYVLDYHVDFLNSSDWKDPLSKIQFSNRQFDFTRVLRLKKSACSQVIVNGNTFTSAEDSLSVHRKIRRALSSKAIANIQVDKEYFKEDRTVRLKFTVEGLEKIRREYFYFYAALVESEINIVVTEGSSSGKKFTHTNVVRVLESSRFGGKTKTGTLEIVFPLDLIVTKSSIVYFVQDSQNMKVLGAGRLFEIE